MPFNYWLAFSARIILQQAQRNLWKQWYHGMQLSQQQTFCAQWSDLPYTQIQPHSSRVVGFQLQAAEHKDCPMATALIKLFERPFVSALHLLRQIQSWKNYILQQGRTRRWHEWEEPVELTTQHLKGLGMSCWGGKKSKTKTTKQKQPRRQELFFHSALMFV